MSPKKEGEADSNQLEVTLGNVVKQCGCYVCHFKMKHDEAWFLCKPGKFGKEWNVRATENLSQFCTCSGNIQML